MLDVCKSEKPKWRLSTAIGPCVIDTSGEEKKTPKGLRRKLRVAEDMHPVLTCVALVLVIDLSLFNEIFHCSF